jgi:CheY-like chemotaxis protein
MMTATPPRRDREDSHPHGVAWFGRGRGLVLIVDDIPDVREMYSFYLITQGFKVLTARDAVSGIDSALQHRPDVVVMDLSMPAVDGVEATHRLKADARTRRIPILILTGYPLRAIAQGALEAGADVFLTKPCLPEDLEQHIERLATQTRRAG